MRPRVKYRSRLVPPGFAAWVIAPYMLFRQPKLEVDDRLFRHEMQHIYQVEKEGWFKFYVKYLYYSIRYGYTRNPYEVEARAHENDKLTTVERYWKDGN